MGTGNRNGRQFAHQVKVHLRTHRAPRQPQPSALAPRLGASPMSVKRLACPGAGHGAACRASRPYAAGQSGSKHQQRHSTPQTKHPRAPHASIGLPPTWLRCNTHTRTRWHNAGSHIGARCCDVLRWGVAPSGRAVRGGQAGGAGRTGPTCTTMPVIKGMHDPRPGSAGGN